MLTNIYHYHIGIKEYSSKEIAGEKSKDDDTSSKPLQVLIESDNSIPLAKNSSNINASNEKFRIEHNKSTPQDK